MDWDNSVVTNAGITLLNQWLKGGELIITSVAAGTGTVAPAALMAQTSLTDQRQILPLVGVVDSDNGRSVQTLITSVNLESGYTLNQVGLWAKLSNGDPVFFAIMQDAGGLPVPSKYEVPEFAIDFFATIPFSNQPNLTVVVDTSSLVTYGTMQEAITEAVKDKAKKPGEYKEGNLQVFDKDGNPADSKKSISDIEFNIKGLPALTDAELTDADSIPIYDESAKAHKRTLLSSILAWVRTKLLGSTSGILKADGKGVISAALEGMDYETAGKAKTVQDNLDTHKNAKNPHGTAASDVGADPSGSAAAVKKALEPIINASEPLYGVCSTAASTAAKVVGIAGFVRELGARISVLLVNANSAATPTLNVSATGDGQIWFRGAPITAAMIPAGHKADLIWDGTRWQLLNPATGDTVWFGTCTTAVGTAAKTSSITGFVAANLATGQMVEIEFANGNSSASATLNITSTGAKGIRHSDAVPVLDKLPAMYRAYCVYDGTYWQVINSATYSRLSRYLQRTIILPDNIDIDLLTDTGFYLTGQYGVIHGPAYFNTGWATLQVNNFASVTTQIISSYNENRMCFRCGSDMKKTPWREAAGTDTAVIKTGDTMTGALKLGSNLLIGVEVSSLFAKESGVSIEMQTNTAVAGGVNDLHTGIRLVAGGMNGWGTAKLYKQTGVGHGVYGPLRKILDEDDIYRQTLSYIGNGALSTTIIFNKTVNFVVITGVYNPGQKLNFIGIFVRPQEIGAVFNTAKTLEVHGAPVDVTWGSTSITIAAISKNDAISALNGEGGSYQVYALA